VTRRRLFVPSFVQTSAMDCGPAALAALLAGFGVQASYGRLREACHTDVDGTSIDTIEDIAVSLGLEAEQTLVPPDHLLLPQARCLPAIVVVRLPSGFTHFVVVWRRLGPLLEVMDPAVGTRLVSARRFLRDLHVHEMPVPAAAFAEWAVSDDFLAPLRRRLRAMRCARDVEPSLVAAVEAGDWEGVARIDAAARIVAAAVRAGGVARGREAARALLAQSELARARPESIPAHFWTAAAAKAGDDGEPRVLLRGAVALTVRGVQPRSPDAPPLSSELAAALGEAQARPMRELARAALGDRPGAVLAALIGTALAAGTLGTVVEALLLRGVMSIGRELGVVQQRLGGALAVVVLLALLLALELPTTAGTMRLGRALELHVRMRLLRKIPRLGDRYFATRPVSDMAERAHALHALRTLPELAALGARTALEVLLTTTGIAWLDPKSAPLALLAAIVAVAIPLFAVPALTEADLRQRTHSGALARFYLDALLGLAPIRTHGAERAVRREHESLLVEWVRTAREVARTTVRVELVQAALGASLSAWLLAGYAHRGGDPGGLVLLVYWALNLPVLGREMASLVRRYPQQRNATLRLLEPLGAREDAEVAGAAARPRSGGVKIVFDGVRVVAGGHTILDGLDLAIEPGTHVAVVGASGAGKSSLLGLLLGWHRPATGRVLVDGAPVDPRLRAGCAWVDPAIMLWNRSAVENLAYGAPAAFARDLPRALAAADLQEVLERLPDGLQTRLGEGGAGVSGGEGQRLRLARALLRSDAGLVLLDEPFRGLDRERRHALMGRAREWWKDATMICVTHDVSETRRFDRVLVVHGGQIVEDGAPGELMARDLSRYRELIEEEAAMLRDVWSGASFRRVRLDAGCTVEDVPSLAEKRASLPRAEGRRT
jgi:ATP-binding cassette subfamily B protein